MFLKIFKREFGAVAKICGIAAGASVAFSAVMGLLLNLISRALINGRENGNIYPYLSSLMGTLAGLVPMGIFAAFIVSVIAVYVRFFKAVSTDEAYLTFTLPAKNSTQFDARFLVILFWVLISLLACALSYVAFAFFTFGNYPGIDIAGFIRGINIIFTDYTLKFIEIVFLALSSAFCVICELVLAIVLGGRMAKKHKVGATIGLIIGFYYLQSAIISVAVVTVTIFLSTSIARGDLAPYSVDIVLWLFTLLAAGIGLLCFFISRNLIANKLNVD